jgi:hypothetical protein
MSAFTVRFIDVAFGERAEGVGSMQVQGDEHGELPVGHEFHGSLLADPAGEAQRRSTHIGDLSTKLFIRHINY